MIVEFDCVVCGNHVRKHWSTDMPGTPRYCSRTCKSEFQRQQKPVDRDWLYQKYIVEGLSAPDIARIVDRNSKRVWEWLRDFGIETRKRGKTDNWKYSIGKPRELTPEGRKKLSAQARAARQKDGRVPYLKDGKHHLKDKRGAETPNWKGGITPERQAFYSTVEWKEAVKAVWDRDNVICQRCGKHHNTASNRGTFDIHHIIGFEVVALRSEVSNLALLCEDCHYFIHSNANVNKEFLR